MSEVKLQEVVTASNDVDLTKEAESLWEIEDALKNLQSYLDVNQDKNGLRYLERVRTKIGVLHERVEKVLKQQGITIPERPQATGGGKFRS